MNQDHMNMIMLALLALNTIMLIYCCAKSSSEEFRNDQSKGGSVIKHQGATKAQAQTRPR